MANYYDTSNTLQPIPLRMRQDLKIQKLLYQAEPYWVVKDPHDQEFYRFNEQEYAVLSWLDGKTSYEEIQDRFDRQFSPFRINNQEITQLISDFFQKTVVVPCRGGIGYQLHEFSREKRRKKLKQKFKNFLAIRWKGWDPDTFLKWTEPYVGWFFSRPMVIFNMLFLLVALCWLGIHYEEFFSRVPSLWSFLNPANWLSLGSAIVLSKLLHELGHAYTNRRFGGDCHEIGVMIFFFMPTLYCNASDSWLLKNKWHRMAIGLGGIYVELFIFSLATFGWWFSPVGQFQTLCVNMMFVCSVSSVVTNGNPLMRYDGYFVLADWLEMPNLAQNSNQTIRRLFLNKCLGIEREVDYWITPFNQRVHVAYAIGAFTFRIFLLSAIGYMIIDRFSTVGLGYVGLLIAAFSISSIFYQPGKAMYDYFKVPGNWQRVKRGHLLATSTVACLLIALVVAVPFPYSITTECSVDLVDEHAVVLHERGQLSEILIKPGQMVKQGDVIARLENNELYQQYLGKMTQWKEVQEQLRNAEIPLSMKSDRRTNRRSLTALRTKSQMLKDELKVIGDRLDSLELKAPNDGMVYGVKIGTHNAETEDQQVNQVHGNPLSESNIGGWLKEGDMVCQIGKEYDFCVHLLLEQKHHGLVNEGDRVTILLASNSNRLSGTVADVSERANQSIDLPQPIFAQSQTPAVQHAKQMANPETKKNMTFKDGQTLASKLFLARVDLDAAPPSLNYGSVGKANVHVGYRTLFWRVKRAIEELLQQSF